MGHDEGRCPQCGAIMRRCCDTMIGEPHRPHCPDYGRNGRVWLENGGKHLDLPPKRPETQKGAT